MTDIKVDPKLVHKSFSLGCIWLIIAGIGQILGKSDLAGIAGDGGITALSFLGSPVLTYGWLSSSAIGLTYYILPHICGCRPVAARIAMFGMWVWNVTLALSLLISWYFTNSISAEQIAPWQAAGFLFAYFWQIYGVRHTIHERSHKELPWTGKLLAIGWIGLFFVLALQCCSPWLWPAASTAGRMLHMSQYMLLAVWCLPIAVATMLFHRDIRGAMRIPGQGLVRMGLILVAIMIFRSAGNLLIPETQHSVWQITDELSLVALAVCSLWTIAGMQIIWPKVYIVFSTTRRDTWLGLVILAIGVYIIGSTAWQSWNVIGQLAPNPELISAGLLLQLTLDFCIALFGGIGLLILGWFVFLMRRTTPELTY